MALPAFAQHHGDRLGRGDIVARREIRRFGEAEMPAHGRRRMGQGEA